MSRLILRLALLFCPLSESFAQLESQKEPVAFNLITVGLGSGIEARYGHTILEVIGFLPHEPIYLNWGTFDFSDPLLPLNFFRGRLRYWLDVTTYEPLDAQYRYFGRTFFRQKINLTEQQKAKFLEKIKDNLAGDHRYFLYHFFYKNCSTIPRDYIDEITNHSIKKALSNSLSTMTFRRYVREYLSTPFFVSFFLDITMNSTIDGPISKWDETFFPLKLSEYLSKIEATDDDGQPIKGQFLLGDIEPIFQGQAPPPTPLYLPFIIGLLSLIFASIVFKFKDKLRLWKIGFILFSICSFIFGSVMLISWIFSDHDVLKHNVNLFFFWPTDLLLIPFILKYRSTNKILYYVSFIHLIVGFYACLGFIIGWIKQDLSLVLLYTVPLFISFYGRVLYDSFNEFKKTIN